MNRWRRVALCVTLAAAGVMSVWRHPPPANAQSHAALSGGPAASAIPAPCHRQLRIAVLSDLNGEYGSKVYGSDVREAVRSLVTRVRPDVVLITGDMVAGQRPNLKYAQMWESFHAAVTTPLTQAGIPVAPVPGNHDACGYPAYAAERAEYARQWSAPARVPATEFVDRTGYPFRYSFTLKGVFFLALDATQAGRLGGDQSAWVDAQLAHASEKVKIGYGHLPLHPVARGRLRDVMDDFDLETTFARRGLTAYLSGHHHAYYPGTAGGFLQVAIPCLGAGPRPLLGSASRTSPKALVVIDIEEDRVARVDALEAPDYARATERGRLPERIVEGRHRLVRDDLAARVGSHVHSARCRN